MSSRALPAGARSAAPSDAARRRPLAALLDALLPPRCVAWGVPLERGSEPFCGAAAETLVEDRDVLGDVAALFAFGGALRDALVRAKYDPDEGRARALARFFGRELSLRVNGLPHDVGVRGLWPSATEAPAQITFVPAHWRRRLTRGFDLPALLADAAGRALALPVVDLLACTRHEAPLSSALTAEDRAARASDRYRLRRSPPASRPGGDGPPPVILLVDDVVTTGASLQAAAAPLLAAGYAVRRLVLARTPPPEVPRHLHEAPAG